jgi:hypothetical protein
VTRLIAGPASGSTVAFGLETWLIGTGAELDAALAALAGAGRLVHVAPRTPLVGADRGRYRTYALTRITAAPTTPGGTNGSTR